MQGDDLQTEHTFTSHVKEDNSGMFLVTFDRRDRLIIKFLQLFKLVSSLNWYFDKTKNSLSGF